MDRDARMPGARRPEDQEKPIGELLRELYQDVSLMIDRQVTLAKHEASAVAQVAGRGAAVVGVGALVGLVGFIYLMLAAVYGLARVMPDWAAAGLIGLVLAVVGAIAASAGIRRIKAVGQPLPRTRETLREDQAWAREEVRELKREVRG